MPRILSPDEILDLLAHGDHSRLIGAVETDTVDFKGAPYQLDNPRDTYELAKDVSAMANSGGGIILLGVATERQPDHPGDTVSEIRPMLREIVDVDRNHKILESRVVPPVPGIEIAWHASAAAEGRGLVSIRIPPSDRRPHLVLQPVKTPGNTPGYLVGYFERHRDAVSVTSPAAIQRHLADGLRYDALLREEFGRLRALLREQPSGVVSPSPSPASDLTRRVSEAIRDAELGGQPMFILAAAASTPTVIPGIVEQPKSDATHWIEHPVQLRESGFGLYTGDTARLIEGNRRVIVAPGRQFLGLWRDGLLLFAVEAGEEFLCWGTPKDSEARWMNQLALIESTYLFATTARNIFELAQPAPDSLNLHLEFRHLTEDRPCYLTPGPAVRRDAIFVGRAKILDGFINPAPASDKFFKATVAPGVDPGLTAYELIKQVYPWFGIEQSKIPYTTRRPERHDSD